MKTITIPIDKIGTTLKQIREDLGLSQAAAAEGAGFTSPVTIGNYERGLRTMDVAKIHKILSAFGMGVASITFTQISSLDLKEAQATNNPTPGRKGGGYETTT